jgi:glucose/arabinose dehydrogenase
VASSDSINALVTASLSRIAAVRPLWAVEGGRVTLEGAGFPVEPRLPGVSFGGVEARIAAASPRAITVVVPPGLDGGRMPVRIEGVAGETAYVDIGAPVATGLHMVDSPIFDAEGNLYVTFSGSRGQESPVSIFVVRPDGSREAFVTEVPNATSLALDDEGRLHVSSRFDGSVYRIEPDGSAVQVATDLGVACGIAFGPDGALYVGDRTGTVVRVLKGDVEPFARLPPSVAAYHLAFGPDGWLYVSVPTLNTRDGVFRISRAGKVETFYEGFGRPQGLAFDAHGHLYVVDAVAGAGGVYRLRTTGAAAAEQLVDGGALVGLAFDPRGGVVLASTDTVYRLNVRSAA